MSLPGGSKRGWFLVSLGLLAGCRDVTLPGLPDPAKPGSISGFAVIAKPGGAGTQPAPGARVELLSTGLATTADATGAFRLDGIRATAGQVLFSLDLDGDGRPDRQRLLTLDALRAGPGREVALGEVLLVQNALLRGQVLLGDVAGARGHAGTLVYVPEGPFTATTSDDGSFVLPELPEGAYSIAFFRAGYLTGGFEGLVLQGGQELALRPATLERVQTTPAPIGLKGRVVQLDGAPAQGAQVTVWGAAPVASQPVGTDGRFDFQGLPVGVYAVVASRPGFVTAVVAGLLVLEGVRDVGDVVLYAGETLDGGDRPRGPLDGGNDQAGQTPLVRVEALATDAGAGYRLESGFDTNRNGLLDPAEVTSSQDVYLAPSVQVTPATPAQCPTGGVVLTSWVDLNLNGLLDRDGGEEIGRTVLCGTVASPSLASLRPSAGVLVPPFDPGTTQYSLVVPLGVPSIGLQPIAGDPAHATVQVDGRLLPSGATSVFVEADPLGTPVQVTVTTDQGQTRTYTVQLQRPSLAAGWTSLPAATSDNLTAVWGSSRSDVWALGSGAGALQHWDGLRWSSVPSGTQSKLSGLWGSSARDVWAVGDLGTIQHWDGTAWSSVDAGSSEYFKAVGGSGPADVWAVSWGQGIVHWDGGSWAPRPSQANGSLAGVWSASPTEAWAVGAGTLLHWVNDGWTVEPTGTQVSALWGSAPNDVWGVGSGGTILHWGGTAWAAVPSPTTSDLVSVWGTSATDAWALVHDLVSPDAMLHWNGSKWSQVHDGTSSWLAAGWSRATDDAWAVGKANTLQHWDGTEWSSVPGVPGAATVQLHGVWASPDGGQVWAVGTDPNGGAIQRWNGSAWTAQGSRSDEDTYNGVWGSGAGDVWPASYVGWTYARYDGLRWSFPARTNFTYVTAIGGTSPTDVYVVGGDSFNTDSIQRFDGTTWTPSSTGTTGWLNGVWADPATGDVWLVGAGGKIALGNGGPPWTLQVSGTTSALSGVWGSSGRDLWAVGDPATLLHSDGTSWSSVDGGTASTFSAVAGNSATNVWAVGRAGAINHYDGSAWTTVDGGTTSDLAAVSVTPAGEVWTVSPSGTILHFQP